MSAAAWQPLDNASDVSSPISPSPTITTKEDRERHSLVDDQFQQPHSPNSPRTTPTFDVPLLIPGDRTPSRSLSSPNFVSSPLNPRAPSSLSTRPRPQSRGSMTIARLASDDSQALGGSVSPFSTLGSGGQRGSMVLYRLAAEEDMGALLPPKLNNNRDSIASSSGDSIFSLSSDSKYPSGITYGGTRGLVPYAYDPAIDDQDPPDEEDMLHDPDGKGAKQNSTFLPWRGFLNVGVLLVLILGLLCLFIFYPVLTFIRNNARNLAIDGNIRINATGQAPKLYVPPLLFIIIGADNGPQIPNARINRLNNPRLSQNPHRLRRHPLRARLLRRIHPRQPHLLPRRRPLLGGSRPMVRSHRRRGVV
jgi:beta-glucan synthesis-associated protein KRE6